MTWFRTVGGQQIQVGSLSPPSPCCPRRCRRARVHVARRGRRPCCTRVRCCIRSGPPHGSSPHGFAALCCTELFAVQAHLSNMGLHIRSKPSPRRFSCDPLLRYPRHAWHLHPPAPCQQAMLEARDAGLCCVLGLRLQRQTAATGPASGAGESFTACSFSGEESWKKAWAERVLAWNFARACLRGVSCSRDL